jgi:predicted DNA-binding transcriptional regulator YafY
MPRRLKRLLDWDRLLRSPTRQTAASLADDLEISERTLRNDLEFMQNRFEAPIAFNPKQGWHYTEPDWVRPLLDLVNE